MRCRPRRRSITLPRSWRGHASHCLGGLLLCAGISAAPGYAELGLDLAYVDPSSEAFARFRDWVDLALTGPEPYGFSATDAAYVARVLELDGGDGSLYCAKAVERAQAQVDAAEALIAGGDRPEIAGDSYLELGPMLRDLGLALAWCPDGVSPAERIAWGAYAEQAIWNVWNPDSAEWGGVKYDWSGWSIADPGNNYHFSFLQGTMYWALAADATTWVDFLDDVKLPLLVAYWAEMPGGGSREGTGYGVALTRLFELYRVWRDSTGEDLAAASSHVEDTIDYWIHATLPTLDRYAPIGDLSRESYPWLYDYHRRLVLEARDLASTSTVGDRATGWLQAISVDEMTSGFNLRDDLLPEGTNPAPPTGLWHHGTGAGHLFARSSWAPDALWMSFVAGRYDQSHAHRDQGAFTLFRDDFLAVTANVFSHSGIQNGSEVHSTLRFEDDGGIVVQRESLSTASVVDAGGKLLVSADLSPAFVGTDAVPFWTRRLEFDRSGLWVADLFVVEAGVEAFFQIQLPLEPIVGADGRIRAGDLVIVPVVPSSPAIELLEWASVDPLEFSAGWRVSLADPGARGTADGRFVVRLQPAEVLLVDGFESGGIEAWGPALD